MRKSKIKTANYVIILLLSVVTFSCSPTRSLLVELPRPSEEELPENIQSLTIVTQTVDDKYTDLEVDSIQRIFYRKDFNLDTVIYDRLVVDTTIQALGELLFESGRYDFVIPQNRFLNQNQQSSPTNRLSWEQVQNLTETYETDAVLSLDYMSTRINTDFSRVRLLNPYTNNSFSGLSAEMDIIYNAVFRVYYPETEQVLLQQVITDTLVWQDADVSVNGVFDNFTPVKYALIETGISVALDMSDKIAVIWDTGQRAFFHRGNDRFEQANEFVDEGDWLSAIELWEQVANESTSAPQKSKAEFNVAFGYEMIGDINQAISWAVKSYETMYRPLTYEYLEELNDRREELQNE